MSQLEPIPEKGEGGLSFPSVSARIKYFQLHHVCKYVMVKKSVRHKANGQQWIERCRCMKFVSVDYRYFVEGHNSPTVTKYWYNKEGDLDRVTGYRNNI